MKNPGIDGNGRAKKSEQLARKVPSTPFVFLRISGVKRVFRLQQARAQEWSGLLLGRIRFFFFSFFLKLNLEKTRLFFLFFLQISF